MKNHLHTQFTDSLHLTLGLTSACPAPINLIFKEDYALFLRLGSAIVPESPLLRSWGTKVTCVKLMLATKPRTCPPALAPVDTAPHQPCNSVTGPPQWWGRVACCLSLELGVFHLTWLFRLLNHLKTLERKPLGPSSCIFKVYTCLALGCEHLPQPTRLSVQSCPKLTTSSHSWEPIRGPYSGLGGRRPAEMPSPAPLRV